MYVGVANSLICKKTYPSFFKDFQENLIMICTYLEYLDFIQFLEMFNQDAIKL